MAGLIQELKRRNVFKVGVAYVVLSWILAQAADLAAETFDAPDWVMKMLVSVLVLGLPLVLFFAWAFEMTPEGIKKEKDVDRSQSITHQTGRKLDFAIIAFLVVALAYFTYDKFVLDPVRDAARESSLVAAAEQQELGKSIAVLPFVNMSDDSGNEYFSDGISEEILNALARVPELQVAGRTSSFAFKGQNQDLRLVADTLGVDHILEGSVRKAGNTVRITAQLIRADNGFHLWSESYDRELDNVFAIQDEIANAILVQMKAQLVGEEPPVVASAPRTNAKAYDLYLLAKQRMYERTKPTIELATRQLDEAIALDPNYAPAYAQRAIATLLLADNLGTYGDIPVNEARAQADLYLDKALALDPELAEGWAGRGLYWFLSPGRTGYAEAEQALKKALSINPGLINASNWLNNTYVVQGRMKESHELLQAMVERDPLYRAGINNAMGMFIEMGQLDRGSDYLERIRPMVNYDPAFRRSEMWLLQARGELALAQQKMDEYRQHIAPEHPNPRIGRELNLMLHEHEAVLAEQQDEWTSIIALVRLGRGEEALMMARRLVEREADYTNWFYVLNMQNRSDEVVAYLEERWPDLAAFQQQNPAYGAEGDWMMLEVALAFMRQGRQQGFDESMRLARITQRNLEELGASNPGFYTTQAMYFALANDPDRSLDFLERAIDRGMNASVRMADEILQLKPLEGDPRYEALQQRMIDHLNSERAKLGLEPATI